MFNITVDNPFDVYSDKILQFSTAGRKNLYYTIKKHFVISITNPDTTISLFLTDEFKIGDCFGITIPEYFFQRGMQNTDINLPASDIFGNDRDMFLSKSYPNYRISILDINDEKFKDIINNLHANPSIVKRIS